MELRKSFVINCRNVRLLREFLCQAIDQVDERDKQIAELKSDIQDLQDDRKSSVKLIDEKNATIAQLEDDVAFWKKKLEDVQATAYAESVDAGMENRKLKRALWLARAKRAIEKIAWFKLWNASISTMNPEDGARQEYDKWKNALGRFLDKAEEYK